MSHFQSEPQRPVMPRRKSSAQNLLSNFKQNSASSASIPPPLNLANSSGPINSTNMSFASAATPTVSTTPMPRDWDSQSLHSEPVGHALTGAQSPPLGQSTTVEVLRDTLQKRIMTLTYIRNIHEGRSHWFHTILISRSELERVFNNHQMRKRTYRFAILGLSLSTLLDINSPQDLLRALINIVTEYDQSKEDTESRGTRDLWRKRFNKSKMPEDGSYLLNPSMPFPLDYHQTLLSLLDVLSELYNKILKLLGPSPFPQSSQNMMGPLGPLLPYPGVSYLFSNTNPNNPNNPNNNPNNPNAAYGYPQPYPQQPYPQSQQPYPHHDSDPNLPSHSNHSQQQQQHHSGFADSDVGGSLWGIANGGGASISGSFMVGGTLSSPPATGWTSSLGDMVMRIDTKLKKITTVLLKDLDTFARNGIRDELASLDPLLRNVSSIDENPVGGGLMYDFEGN